jgi:DNA-binding LacI/PurR family transcriptional regulator
VNGVNDGPTTPKRATMADVAQRAGVSRTLVSLVLRGAPGAGEATRQRVLAAAEDLGYRPDAAAQMLRSNRSRNIGVLFTARHVFDLEFIENLYPPADKHGYHLVLGAMTTTRDEYHAVRELLGYRCEALVLLGPDLDKTQLSKLAGHVPIVDIARIVRHPHVDVVRTADDRGVRLAVDHLVELGHREIWHVDGGNMPSAGERRRGYRTAMRRHGLHDQIHIIEGDYTEESGARAAEVILSSDTRRPTAVVAGNDRCAFGLLDTFRHAKVSVPEEISIVGYDDSRLARLSFIEMTSVRQDVERMAELAIEAIVERLDDGRTEARHIVLQPMLAVRSTTASPTDVA